MQSANKFVMRKSLGFVFGGAALRQQAVAPVGSLAGKSYRFFNTEKRLTEETMSQNVVKMEYAVRGEVVNTAAHLEKDIHDHPEAHPGIDHVLYTNIGNPHSVGNEPLLWPRMVMALCDLPNEVGIDNPEASRLYPKDVIERAREIKATALHHQGTGSYSHSQGCFEFRENIAKFIEARDGGVKSNPEEIFMTNGASAGIDMLMTTLLAGEDCGTMIPIPQYPLYSATIALKNGHQVNYYLDEEKGWGLDMENLEKVYADATADGITVNSFVLINPGNPTGQVLSREDMHNVVKFCAKHKLVLLSDEVYQDNVYDENAEFVSAKRAAYEVGLLEQDAIELASFHSTSKGLYGECGHRGGYMELVGFDKTVVSHIYKLASSFLCPNVDGQILMDLMVKGPDPGSESYEKHEKQKKALFDSLQRRAKIVAEGLNSIPGFSCQPAQGSMYCFPSVQIPEAAIKDAERNKMNADTFYALSLLRSTGICVVPASGFGQKPGRHGFRTTFLPPEDEMAKAVESFRKHHEEFCAKYSDETVAA